MPLCAEALGRARWEGPGWWWPCRDTPHGVPGDSWAVAPQRAAGLGPYFVSSVTSTSVGAVMGAFECPAVGSSVFSSPLVELITWGENSVTGDSLGGCSPSPPHGAQEPPRTPPSCAQEHRGALGGRMVPSPRPWCLASLLSSPQEPHHTERSESLRMLLEGSQLLGAPAPGEGLAGSQLQQGLGKLTGARSPSHS